MKKALLLVPSLLLLASCTITGPLPGQSVTPAPSQSAEPTPSQSGSVTPSQSTSGTSASTSTSVAPTSQIDKVTFNKDSASGTTDTTKVTFTGEGNKLSAYHTKGDSAINYSNFEPFRFYKNSKVVFSCSENFTKLLIDCTSDKVYSENLTAIANSVWSAGSIEAGETEKQYVWTSSTPVDSVTVTFSSEQARLMFVAAF